MTRAAWGVAEAARAPGHTSGRIAIAALAATVVTSVWLLVLALPLLDADTWIEGFDGDGIDAVSALGGVVSLVTAVAYLSWSFKITEGYPWLTGFRPGVGKVAAVGWWFVPLAGFVMPAVTLNGLQRGLALPGRGRPAWLIAVWWAGFWLSRLLNGLWELQLTDLNERFSTDAEEYAATTSLLLASEALSVVSAVALIAILVRIGRDAAVRQRAAIGALPWPPPPEVG